MSTAYPSFKNINLSNINYFDGFGHPNFSHVNYDKKPVFLKGLSNVHEDRIR